MNPSRTGTRALQANPFSTCFVKPGKLPLVGIDSETLSKLVDRFVESGWLGQIVGPHGVGKTTLTFAIVEKLLKRWSNGDDFESILVCRLTIDSIRSTRGTEVQQIGSGEAPRRIFVVDGIERLSQLDRMALIYHCRRKDVGLLATTHRRVFGLPELTQWKSSKQTFRNIVERLLSERADKHAISDETTDRVFDQCEGNIRESLMCLYDIIEASRESQARP